MGPALLELRPKVQLLDSNFDGYKLSLEEIQTTKKNFNNNVDRVLLDPNQYTLLHAKFFGLHNHLVGESKDGNDSLYFFDKDWNLCKTYVDPFTNEFIDPIIVWNIVKERERQSGDYNISLKFISEDLAIASGGDGNFFILNTGSRNDDDDFTEVYKDKITEQEKGFVIIDGVLKEHNELHALISNIQQDSDTEKYLTVLYWITFTKDKGTWGQTALRELKIKGSIQYSGLEKSCEALYVVSENGCKFTVNSETPIIEEKTEIKPKKTYIWSQNIEDITIKFPKPENFNKSQFSVTSQVNSIEIKYNNLVLLSGELSKSIDSNVTMWTETSNYLEVVLSKSEVGVMWDEVVIGDQFGENVLDTCIVQDVHEKLAHLCSDREEQVGTGSTFNSQQVEECDFETDCSTIFERLESKTNSTTHKINLGSHQVLVVANLYQDLPPAVGFRHDVDVCLWQPRGCGENFNVKHEGTLLAFGYVQASKQQRKFTVCPPDMSYSAICESTRHLFIYRQKKPVSSSELRNRTTGRIVRNIAQQQVVNIPNEEILGIYSSNSALYLLGEKFIMLLKL